MLFVIAFITTYFINMERLEEFRKSVLFNEYFKSMENFDSTILVIVSILWGIIFTAIIVGLVLRLCLSKKYSIRDKKEKIWIKSLAASIICALYVVAHFFKDDGSPLNALALIDFGMYNEFVCKMSIVSVLLLGLAVAVRVSIFRDKRKSNNRF